MLLDKGREIANQEVEELLRELRVVSNFTTTGHFGPTEPFMVLVHRTIHTVAGKTAFEVFRAAGSVKQAIRQRHFIEWAKRVTDFNHMREEDLTGTLPIGDLAYIVNNRKRKKSGDQFLGPFVIV